MKFVDEYRSPDAAAHYVSEIKRLTTRPWTVMEICGGQTHSIVRYGIDQVLPEQISLLHGPGCPVCVTAIELIDKAVEIASRPEVIFCSFGDMLRVPGSSRDLLSAKASGADVRTVYSPLDAVTIARDNPGREVVFFAVGFETTAPANAAAVFAAKMNRLENFSLLVAQVLVPPAIEMILDSPACRVQGFLAPGHVCTVAGYEAYERLAQKYHIPMVVTGFEPLDILQGICMTIAQLETGRATVENQYARAAKRDGNQPAQKMMRDVFVVIDRAWRGLGVIPQSGLGLSPDYAQFDAEKRFATTVSSVTESPECISGLVLQGRKKPHECPAFGARCTPDHPLGAPMVSSEGACAAYFRYKRAGK